MHSFLLKILLSLVGASPFEESLVQFQHLTFLFHLQVGILWLLDLCWPWIYAGKVGHLRFRMKTYFLVSDHSVSTAEQMLQQSQGLKGIYSLVRSPTFYFEAYKVIQPYSHCALTIQQNMTKVLSKVAIPKKSSITEPRMEGIFLVQV